MTSKPLEGGGLSRLRALISHKNLFVALMVAVLTVSCFVFINDSDESEAAYADTVYVANTYSGITTLNNGDTVDYENSSNETASYVDGVLTLTNFRGTVYDNMYVINGGTSASIYAAGDLTIVFEGSGTYAAFLGYNAETQKCYGIYVEGNLTMINRATADYEVRFDPYECSATIESAGIYCTGKLTVRNESEHAFTLTARGDDAAYDAAYAGGNSTSPGFRTFGVHAEGGITIGSDVVLNAKGGQVPIGLKQGVVCSFGVMSGTYEWGNVGETAVYYTSIIGSTTILVESGGRIIAEGGEINNTYGTGDNSIYYTVSAGIGGNSMTVNGSAADYDPEVPETATVKATGGRVHNNHSGNMGAGGMSYGMWVGDLIVNGGNVVAEGSDVDLNTFVNRCESYGLHVSCLTVNADGRLYAEAGESWMKSYGIYASSTDGIIVNGGHVEAKSDYVVSSNGYMGATTGIMTINLSSNGGTIIGYGGTATSQSVTPIGIQCRSVSLSNGASVTGYGGTSTVKYTGTIYSTTSGNVKDSVGIMITGTTHSVDGEETVLEGIGGDLKSNATTGAFDGATYGIQLSSSDPISITGNGTVSARGGKTDYNSSISDALSTQDNLESIGLYSKGALNIAGTTVNAAGGDVCLNNNMAPYRGSITRGIFAESDLVLSGGATVNATGGDNKTYAGQGDEYRPWYNDSYGAYANGSISVSGSTLNAVAGVGSVMVGIYANGPITLTNGATVNAISDESKRIGYIKVTGGINRELNANAYGIFVNCDGTADASVTDGRMSSTASVPIKFSNANNTLNAAHIFGSVNRDYFFASSREFTVSFHENTGSGSMDDVTAFGTYHLPDCDFTAPYGKRFAGWALGSTSGDVYDAGESINVLADIELYATWEDLSTYDISFTNTGGLTLSVKIGDADQRALTEGEMAAGKITAIPEGTAVRFTAAAITGYNLFYQANGGAVTSFDNGYEFTVTGATSIAFTKTLQTFTVIWKNGEETLEIDEGVGYGTAPVFDNTEPTKAGTDEYTYTFAGWALSAGQESGSAASSLSVTDDVTYYAAFSKTVNKYVATLYLNGGVASPSTGWTGSEGRYTKEFAYGTTKDEVISDFGEYTRDGYTERSVDSTAETMGLGGMTITVQWAEHVLTVTFKGNGSTDGEMIPQVIRYSSEIKTLSTNAFAKTHYIFTGWNTASDGSGTDYADGSNVSGLITATDSTLTLHAQWEEKSKFTVTFESNGGSAVTPQEVYDGEFVVKPTAPEKENYIFAGWYTDNSTFESLFDFDHTAITENKTLYAKWDNHEHILVYHAAVAPTCTEDGSIAYWECSVCGTRFSDAGGTVEIDSIAVPALGHDWGGWIVTVQPTCTDYGTETRYCKHDPSHSESRVVPMVEHTLVAVESQEATCTEPGHIAHYVCSVCHKLFSDSEGNNEITASDVTIAPLGHVMEHHTAKDATCTESGNIEYWYCTRCAKYFSDSEGNNEISESSVTIAPLGHSYSVTFEWSADGKTCTVHIVCARDAGHNHDIPATATSVKKTDATFSTMGITTYSVSGTYDSFAYADSIDIADIPYAAKEEGGTKTYEDTVPAGTEKNVTDLFNAAKEANGSVEVVSDTSAGALSIAFDGAAVNAIGAGTDVTLKADVIENSSEVPDANLVIEITLAGATFSEGKAKVSLPFSQAVPEGKVVRVYFINGDVREDMNAALVDGKVIFETNHFSTYAVFFEDASSPSGNNGGGFPIWIVAVIAVVAIAAVGGAFFFMQQKKKA